MGGRGRPALASHRCVSDSLLFSQGERGPLGPPGLPGFNGNPVSIQSLESELLCLVIISIFSFLVFLYINILAKIKLTSKLSFLGTTRVTRNEGIFYFYWIHCRDSIENKCHKNKFSLNYFSLPTVLAYFLNYVTLKEYMNNPHKLEF